MIYKEFKNGGIIYHVHEYCLSCGECHEEYHSLEHHRIKDFLLSAREQGWSIGNKVTCPNCKKRKEEKVRSENAS